MYLILIDLRRPVCIKEENPDLCLNCLNLLVLDKGFLVSAHRGAQDIYLSESGRVVIFFVERNGKQRWFHKKIRHK